MSDIRIHIGTMEDGAKVSAEEDGKSAASSTVSADSCCPVSTDGNSNSSNNFMDAAKNSKPSSASKKVKQEEPPFVGSVDNGENYYDLFRQTRTLYEFKTPIPSKRFQQPREVPRPVVLGAVDVAERWIQRILYEIFSIFRFALALIVTILTETLKLIVRGLIQPLIVAFITIIGSHLLQPVLVSFFNYILQPYLSFVNNVLAMVGQTLQPWLMMIGHLMTKVAEVLRSVRLAEVNLAPRQASNNGIESPQKHQV